jgi:hypothetical protein
MTPTLAQIHCPAFDTQLEKKLAAEPRVFERDFPSLATSVAVGTEEKESNDCHHRKIESQCEP